jgi:uncharacterized membrane protein YqaE (UPF0057 family)
MPAATDTNTLLLAILSILLPPLAVGLKTGLSGTFVLNVVLTLIFWLPGVIHALIVTLA